MIRLIELLLILVIIFAVFTQIIIPKATGYPLFPFFRRRKLRNDISHEREFLVEDQLRQDLDGQRRARQAREEAFASESRGKQQQTPQPESKPKAPTPPKAKQTVRK
jgi:hypothetical protein